MLAPLAPIPLVLAAQSPCDVLLADSVGDQLVRLADEDGDGAVLTVHEASVLWREDVGRTPRAVAAPVVAGPPEVLWIDSADDHLLRGADVNGDGRVEPFERRLWRDSGALDGSSTARGLAVTTDGAVWWTSDSGLRGLFRIRDLDGDGLGAGADEARLLLAGSDGAHPIETAAGPVLVDARHLTELVAHEAAVVVYADGPDEALLRFEELGGDGALDDPGEARLFLNASGKHPLLPRNVDWESGRLRELRIPASGGGSFYGRLSKLAMALEPGGETWYLGCDSALGSPYDTNVNGERLNGLVFRARDLDGDGALQSAGEVRLWYDGSGVAAEAPMDQVLALDACGGALYVAYLYGGDRRVARLEDRDGDGVLRGPGEVEPDWFTASAWRGQPPFEQGDPFVRDLVAVPSSRFAPPNALVLTLGPGCEGVGGSATPTAHSIGRARIGSGFDVELRGVAAAHWGFLLIGEDTPTLYQHLLPVELDFLGLPGCFQYLVPRWVRRHFTEAPLGAFDPAARHRVSVPPLVDLAGSRLRLQWVVFGPAGGVTFSDGIELVVEEN